MTSTEYRYSGDQQIANAAALTRPRESAPLERPAFERHYRIGELAEMWKLGRETVRLLVKDEQGVISGSASTPCGARPVRPNGCLSCAPPCTRDCDGDTGATPC